MWPWIKRWRDWAMHDLWPMHRIGRRPQALHSSYEKAGLTISGQPIPWNAEAVLVEGLVRLPAGSSKADFQLAVSGQPPVPVENLTAQEGENRSRLTFRFPPPPKTFTAKLLWRSSPIGETIIPVLGREEFVKHLQVQMPTLSVRLGDQTVACQTFVATQCRGLIASALLTSPTSLVPLLDLGLHLEVRSERSGTTHRFPVQLSSSQLAGRQSLVTTVPRRWSRHVSTYLMTWLAGDHPLCAQRVRAISQKDFHRSLRVCSTRFVVQSSAGAHLHRQIPPLQPGDRFGPCFMVTSREPGMAALCSLQVHAQVAGALSPPLMLEQEVLVTDGPVLFTPGTLEESELGQVNGFELRRQKEVLGVLSLCPAPSASFTSEGGFKSADDYLWSAAAEDELTERLTRLMQGPDKNA